MQWFGKVLGHWSEVDHSRERDVAWETETLTVLLAGSGLKLEEILAVFLYYILNI